MLFVHAGAYFCVWVYKGQRKERTGVKMLMSPLKKGIHFILEGFKITADGD